MRSLKVLLYTVFTVLFVSNVPVVAQDKPTQNDTAYRPSLADIMSTTQLRHFKLWYAARVKNWPLADYELAQINASFKEAMRFYGRMPAADMTSMDKPAALIREAIKAKDTANFDKAFGQLTTECNACHEAADRAFIFIRVPTRSPFSNQLFPPREK
jgi:hypothetical protein